MISMLNIIEIVVMRIVLVCIVVCICLCEVLISCSRVNFCDCFFVVIMRVFMIVIVMYLRIISRVMRFI